MIGMLADGVSQDDALRFDAAAGLVPGGVLADRYAM